MDDRPSISAAVLRILVGIAVVAIGLVRIGGSANLVDDLRRAGLGIASYGTALGVVEVVCGVVLVLGLAPRLAALILFVDAAAAAVREWRTDGLAPGLVAPVLLAFLLFVLLASGGGRWRLIDRIDPAPPRRLLPRD